MSDLDVTLTPLVDGEPWSDSHPAPVRDAATLAALTGLPAPQTDALTDEQLRAAPVTTNALTRAELDEAAVGVADDYAAVEHLPDQAGADAVLTFNAAAAGRMVWVDVDPVDPADTDNYRCRATVDGATPTASVGWVCRPGANPIPAPMVGTTVKVWTPSGVTVAVQVLSRG